MTRHCDGCIGKNQRGNTLDFFCPGRPDEAEALREEVRDAYRTIAKVDVAYGQMRAKRDRLAARCAQLEAALRSIAANTCCDRCHEAALVATAALEQL